MVGDCRGRFVHRLHGPGVSSRKRALPGRVPAGDRKHGASQPGDLRVDSFTGRRGFCVPGMCKSLGRQERAMSRTLIRICSPPQQ